MYLSNQKIQDKSIKFIDGAKAYHIMQGIFKYLLPVIVTMQMDKCEYVQKQTHPHIQIRSDVEESLLIRIQGI